ncbi:transcriptional activator of acetoin/glycerol metabolism [Burkholderiales bacterium JOSHI_001]|nr:transcriptional activator of acetoin/glycerol metabolism [Burkholderiales bacterium JOSHI_001]
MRHRMTDPESRQHVQRVLSTLEHPPGAATTREDGAGEDWLTASWQRSMQRWRLDPAGSSYRRVLGAAELREAAERIGMLVHLARPHVDALDRHIAPASYCILLADGGGVTLDFRQRGDTDSRFKRAGVRPGVCWAEESEGTNGVGTAIQNRAAVLVHKTDHFRVDNIPLSCSAAPVFGLDDELLAVLDASTLYSPYQRDSQQLVFNLVQEKALLIENAFADYQLREHWRLSFCAGSTSMGGACELLMAFDDCGRIVAANRPARRLLERLSPSGPASLSTLFDVGPEQLMAQAHAAPGLAVPLRVCGTGELMHGLLRAPQRAAEAHARRSDPSQATAPGPAAPGRGFAHLATGDNALAPLVQRALRIVNRDMPIMLLGETGTGKEAFAQALHAASLRSGQPFVALNCAAIPDTLIEAELFGYRDGAFTGARARGARGKVLQADGGTLFLDEIGDMPLALQSRLLRVLAEGEVTPLGADEPVAVRLSVICATHQDLPTLVAEGRFREDLFYRLAGACFRLPPLRERTDRAELIRLLLREEARASGRRHPPSLSPGALQRLLQHPWPGNIRQLRLALRYALAVAEGDAIQPGDFADELWAAAPPTAAAALVTAPGAAPLPAPAPAQPSAPMAASEPGERERIEQALRRLRWNASAAAVALGLSRSTLYRRMRSLGIVAPHRVAPVEEADGHLG